MKILVTGAHGFLGRSVLRQDVAEVELVDIEQMEQKTFLSQHKGI